MSKDFGKEFDDKMVDHLKVINKGGALHLQSFLDEIVIHDYNTVSQIMGALASRVELLKERCDD